MSNDERSSKDRGSEPSNESDDDSMTIRCPQCSTKFKVTLEAAKAAMSAKCPRGHEVPLMKGL